MANTKQRQKYQVLLVGNNEADLKQLHHEFARRGLAVKGTRSGKSAYKYLSSNVAHILICTEETRDIDSLHLTGQLRELPIFARVPIIFLSSSDQFKQDVKELEDQFVEVWSTGTKPGKLLLRTKEMLQRAIKLDAYRFFPGRKPRVGTSQGKGAESTKSKVQKELDHLELVLNKASQIAGLSKEDLAIIKDLVALVKAGKQDLSNNQIKKSQECLNLIHSELNRIKTLSDDTIIPLDVPDRSTDHFDENIERRKSMSKIEQLVESIGSLGGITKLVIASKDGTILSKQGVKGDQFGSFVTFVAISAEHVKGTMGFTVLNHLTLNRSSGEKILVLVGPKVIVGLELGSSTAPGTVVDSLKPIINRVTV